MRTVEKILVTGADGLVGSEFKTLAGSKHPLASQIVAKNRQELDIADYARIEGVFDAVRPRYVVNCAAYTNVDRAESEPNQARIANVEGPLNLARACLKYDAKLIHYGTDFVFDGKKREPYVESDLPAPLNAYARSKWEGEQALSSILPEKRRLILRISWPYGPHGKTFIHTLWELSKTRKEVRVVTDQVGTPNPAQLLAEKTLNLLPDATGLFHLSCRGFCSRFELIRFLFKELQSSCSVIPTTSSEFPSPAVRPAYSALGTERTDLALRVSMPEWKDALKVYFREHSWK